MAISRYARASRLNFGNQQGTSNAIAVIRRAIKDGSLVVLRQIQVRGRDRLDTLAGEVYNDGRYWWILAAASDIGWGLQVPPGTIVFVPDLDSVLALVG